MANESSTEPRREKIDFVRLGIRALFAATLAIYPINYLARGSTEVSTGFLTFVGILAGLMLALEVTKISTTPLEDTPAGKKIQEAENRLEQNPEKSKFAWDLARATLDAYFQRNLSQIRWIFWLSLAVMIAGFGIIVYGITQTVAVTNQLALRTDAQAVNAASIKNLPAVISTVAGLLTEFIGATFLFIYRSTIQQAANHARTLERINSIGMAMQIFDTMPDKTAKDDLKTYTKARTIELFVRGAYEQTGHLVKVPSPDGRKTRKKTNQKKDEPG